MSEMVYMYGFGFGGPPGRNVTVHVTYGGATGSGANVSCTNGKKTFYGVTDTNGNFAFKLAKGRWTITANKSGSTSSVNVDITGDRTVNISLFSATIHVSCPSGLTCKATNGATTLTAPNTSGAWDFVVPNAGTWVIYLNNAKAASVAIAKNGEKKTVNKWYLYNNGVDNTYLTGGLTGSGYDNGSQWTFADTYIGIFPNGFAAFFGTNKKINMKNVKSVSVKATLGQNPWNAYLRIRTSKTGGDQTYAALKDSGELTASADVTGVTTDSYVVIQDSTYVDIKVREIWIQC